MSFPVLGQVIGLLLMLFASEIYVNNISTLVKSNNVFNHFSIIFFIFFIIVLPGFFIFVKALIDYLIAYGAINSMAENAVKSGRVYDFTAHTELINRRSLGFFTLWFLFGLFSIIAFCPLIWIIGGVAFIYFVLIFQVFTFEPDKSPIGCFRKSFNIINGNFARTVFIMAVLGGFTYLFVPELVKYLFTLGHITDILAIPFLGCAKQLPLTDINKLLALIPMLSLKLTPIFIAKVLVDGLISYILICFSLPFRSIGWTLWYFALNRPESKIDNELLKRATRSKKDEPSFKIDD
ncbi:hypothetical protein KBA27_04130 [bacterium]|nr:hypothetical protein [bacterium]